MRLGLYQEGGEDVRCPPEGRTGMEWVYLLQTLPLVPGAGTHTCSDPAVTGRQPSARPGVHKQPNLAYHPFCKTPVLLKHSHTHSLECFPWLLSCRNCARLLSRSGCPALCDPVDCSPPGSAVRGILQAGVLGWGAILSSSRFS